MFFFAVIARQETDEHNERDQLIANYKRPPRVPHSHQQLRNFNERFFSSHMLEAHFIPYRPK